MNGPVAQHCECRIQIPGGLEHRKDDGDDGVQLILVMWCHGTPPTSVIVFFFSGSSAWRLKLAPESGNIPDFGFYNTCKSGVASRSWRGRQKGMTSAVSVAVDTAK